MWGELLLRDGIKLDGLSFHECNFLHFGDGEVAKEGLDDGGGGIEGQVVELHL